MAGFTPLVFTSSTGVGFATGTGGSAVWSVFPGAVPTGTGIYLTPGVTAPGVLAASLAAACLVYGRRRAAARGV